MLYLLYSNNNYDMYCCTAIRAQRLFYFKRLGCCIAIQTVYTYCVVSQATPTLIDEAVST